jgi:hypothetical protein
MIGLAPAGYSSGVDEKVDTAVAPASPAPVSGAAPTQVIMVPVQRAPMGRAPVIFALLSLVLALGAGAVYVLHRSAAPPELTPEQTVNEFLSAVFLSADPGRAGSVVCAGWSGQDAVDRTTQQIETGAHVSWDQVRLVAITDTTASATARIGQRLPDDTRPSLFVDWRFQLRKENGWRVCEARPLAT